jgi:hypothetical protein
VVGAGKDPHGQAAPVGPTRSARSLGEQRDAVGHGHQLVGCPEQGQVLAAQAEHVRDRIVVLLALEELPRGLVQAGPVLRVKPGPVFAVEQRGDLDEPDVAPGPPLVTT